MMEEERRKGVKESKEGEVVMEGGEREGRRGGGREAREEWTDI